MHLIYLYISVNVLFLTNLKLLTSSQFCGTSVGLIDYCCDNYYYDIKRNSCLECPRGSYGQNCSKICVVPKYGWLCYQECKCADFEYCDIADGCLNVSTTSISESLVDTTVVDTTVMDTTAVEPRSKDSTSVMPLVSQSIKTENPTTEKKSTPRQGSGYDDHFVITVAVSVGLGITLLFSLTFTVLCYIFRRKLTYPVQKTENETPNLPQSELHTPSGNLESDVYMEIEETSNTSGELQDKSKDNVNTKYDQLSKSVSNSSRYSEIGKYYTDIEKYKTFTTHKALCNKVNLKRHNSWHHVIEPLKNCAPPSPKKANSYLELCEDETYLHVVHNLKSIDACREFLYSNMQRCQPPALISRSLPKLPVLYDDVISVAQ